MTGVLYGLLAAALFGVSTPLAKRLLGDMTAPMLAGLLYSGAALALLALGRLRGAATETPLRRSDTVPLAGIVVLGGLLAPVLLLVGLSRLASVTTSLLLNLEAPFTIAVAVLAFGEHGGRRVAFAASLIVAGAILLPLEPGALRIDVWGFLAVAGACLCWAVDNNLTQQLSLRDPIALVRVKALAAGAGNVLLALALGAEVPNAGPLLLALCVGALSYGVSVLLDAHALRLLGAAREAALFATAPFAGALASTVLLGERLGAADVLAMACMAGGVGLLLRERHRHTHVHDEIEHEHRHTHDEHHQHAHDAGVIVSEPHSHPHHHAALVHDHPHTPDAHHRHRHA